MQMQSSPVGSEIDYCAVSTASHGVPANAVVEVLFEGDVQ